VVSPPPMSLAPVFPGIPATGTYRFALQTSSVKSHFCYRFEKTSCPFFLLSLIFSFPKTSNMYSCSVG
jgi:hypothetical protein